MAMRIEISTSVITQIRQDSTAAVPREACGLLFGEDGAVTKSQTTENTAENPLTHFEIDPRALIAALRAERGGGPRLAGYWHSHPSGSPDPSPTDAAMAASDGKLWLIVAGTTVRGWRAVADGPVHGRFEPVELTLRG